MQNINFMFLINTIIIVTITGKVFLGLFGQIILIRKV